jgi:ligand-binding SRPBCC domain-containing protein
MDSTNEKAISGKTDGLIGLGERVRWRARHFGIMQELEVEITAFEQNLFFKDEMIAGAFSSMCHLHEFEEKNGGTLMRDYFEYKSPFGPIGRLVDVIFLESYMRQLLTRRNTCIKKIAEGETWKDFLV